MGGIGARPQGCVDLTATTHRDPALESCATIGAGMRLLSGKRSRQMADQTGGMRDWPITSRSSSEHCRSAATHCVRGRPRGRRCTTIDPPVALGSARRYVDLMSRVYGRIPLCLQADRLTQGIDLLLLEPPKLTRCQLAEPQAADPDPTQPLHLAGDFGQHAAYLALSPFGQHDTHPVPCGSSPERKIVARTARASPSSSTTPWRSCSSCGSPIVGAVHERVVLLFDPEPRVRESKGQLAIVGEQHQPLGIDIEPPDGIDALRIRHELDHGRPALGIVRGADHAKRFVEGHVLVRRLTARSAAVHRPRCGRVRHRPGCPARPRPSH